MSAELEHVHQSKVHQAQLLAEARQKVQIMNHREKTEAQTTRAEIKSLINEVEERKDKESQVSYRIYIPNYYFYLYNLLHNEQLQSFQNSVCQLVFSHCEGNGKKEDTANAIVQLKMLLASRLKYKANVQNLEATLKELERNFRTSYQDAITVLNTDL